MTVYESTAPRGGGVTVAAALLAVVTIVGLLTRPLLAIDETRYAAVALEMLASGNWLVPHLNGATYSHKPPLLFWLVMAGWKLLGVALTWARLVGPLAGIVALWLVSRLSRALWPADARARGWAPLITAGALIYAAFGSLFMFDTLLACSALLALLGIVHAVEHGRRRGVLMLAAGIMLGILSKGPVILLHVLPVALAAPWWCTPRDGRRWRIWYLSLLGGVLLGIAGALLWAIPAGIAGGTEYRDAIFLGQTAGRMTKSFAHRRAVWWYLPLLPAVLFPWFLWIESWRAIAAVRRLPRDVGVRFCSVWGVAGLTAFSLVSGKQLHYLLPLVPAVALLIARGLSLREAAPLRRPWLVAGATILLGAAVVVAGTTHLADRAIWWPHEALHWWWALLPIASGVMLLVWARGRITRNAAIHSLAVTTAMLLCGLQLAAARAATVPYDTTPMSAAVRSALRSGRAVAMVGAYNGEYHFAGRLQDQRIDVITADEAGGWLRAHDRGLLLRYDRGRDAPVDSQFVARHPFRNGWATLSPTAPSTASRTGVARD